VCGAVTASPVLSTASHVSLELGHTSSLEVAEQNSAVQYSEVQYSEVQYSAVQCDIVQCCIVQRVVQFYVLHSVVLHCIMLYCIVLCVVLCDAMSCHVMCSQRGQLASHTLSPSLSLSLSLSPPFLILSSLPPPLFSLFPYPFLSTPTRPPPSGHITVVGPDAASVQMAREMLELFTETHELKPHQIDFLSHDYGMLSKLHHTQHHTTPQQHTTHTVSTEHTKLQHTTYTITVRKFTLNCTTHTVTPHTTTHTCTLPHTAHAVHCSTL
jgi:hypothetical protein